MTEPEQKTYIVTTAQTVYEEYPIPATNAEHAKSIWRSLRGRLVSTPAVGYGDDEQIIDAKEYE